MRPTGQMFAVLCCLLVMTNIAAVSGQCHISSLPTIAMAIHDGTPGAVVNDGTTVTYTCTAGYRIAPASTIGGATVNTEVVTCMGAMAIFSPNSFTEFSDFSCVRINPLSCKDYFSRDNGFGALVPVHCDPVTLNPGTGDVGPVDCCKISPTEIRTQIGIQGGTTAVPLDAAGNCINTGMPPATVMPTTSFNGDVSRFCNPLPEVMYDLTDAEISTVVGTTKGCSQRIRYECEDTYAVALALKYFNEPSAFIYGTNVYDVQGAAGQIDLSHYAYTGRRCACAEGFTGIGAGDRCADGCNCARLGQVTGGGVANRRDNIDSQRITVDNLNYVKHVMATQHNSLIVPIPATATVEVRPISCREPFP